MFHLEEPLPAPPMLSDGEFAQLRRFIHQAAGIAMSPGKRSLIQSRLAKRLRQLRLNSYAAYWRMIADPANALERQYAINLLSTNETYFFREPEHFAWLRQLAARRQGGGELRLWSAACSSGEEAYTIAMILAETLGLQGLWRVYATDINTRVTAFARRAVYPQAKASRTPPDLWRRYLLRGRAEYAGMVKVAPELARKVSFSNLNLLHAAHFQHSRFDVIFLRNVLIYFDEATKLRVLLALCDKLREGGHLIIGHSESIRHLELPLTQEAPSRYRLDSRFADGRIDEHRRSDC
ncbi:protein-glutamate O-methyltransferase CheR [Chromobacterium sp.]|uniref:CheR family methyltransferase n=1 Tax=Chromobacterium sp. TaxID=306190 RepID=UPI0035B29C39